MPKTPSFDYRKTLGILPLAGENQEPGRDKHK